MLAVFMNTLMANTYKLICTDIDGTLLNAERSLSETTVSAFAKANATTILASSRMPGAMYYLQEGLHIQNAPLIAYNGGLILGHNQAVLQSNMLPLDVLEALLPHHKTQSYNLSIYADNDWFTDQEDFWSLREINNTRVTPTYQEAAQSLALLKTQGRAPHKLMCMGAPHIIDSIIALLQEDFGSTVHLYRSKDTYLEISPKGIDKSSALQLLLDNYFDYGMEAVIAFGDNHNDMELIRDAGLGVAVANATTPLKTSADYVSPYTNKEHAVAEAIQKFLIVE